MYPLYTLYAPSYSHYIPSMHPVCTLYISCMCLVGSLSMHLVCTLYIPSMYPLYTLYAPCMYPLYTLRVPCMYPDSADSTISTEQHTFDLWPNSNFAFSICISIHVGGELIDLEPIRQVGYPHRRPCWRGDHRHRAYPSGGLVNLVLLVFPLYESVE